MVPAGKDTGGVPCVEFVAIEVLARGVSFLPYTVWDDFRRRTACPCSACTVLGRGYRCVCGHLHNPIAVRKLC